MRQDQDQHGSDGGDGDGAPVWPRWGVPIRDMTTSQLAAAVARLRAGTRLDEVLIRAVQTELTFRQAGIRPHPGPPSTPDAETPGQGIGK